MKTTLAVEPLRIAIADDHVLTRESLFSMISQGNRNCELVAEASTAAETLLICQRFIPNLLLLDVDIAGKSGVALVADIKRVAPATRVLLYCTTVEEGDVLAAMRAGADGFLEKTCSRSDFLQAIERVCGGDHYLCPRTVNALAKSLRRKGFQDPETQRRPGLTRREKEILALIAAGDSSKEIAKKLFLSVSTVETHRANVMTKIGARNVAQLIQYGFQNGLIKFAQTAAVTD
ncbi:MAG: hypothetical protein DME45_09740 [Verrucomicrobia bacterium]|nr:MAG: hypothetical protein DME45_09740 [Verrucomicrobiota bacterium]